MKTKRVTPRLVVIEGKDKGKVIPLQDGTVVIGRSKGDVLIQDPRVSRSHAAVNFDGASGRLTFTDLKSLNGTLVNGQTSEAGDLKDGDKLQLGNTVFDCQVTGEEIPVAVRESARPSHREAEKPAKQTQRRDPEEELQPLDEDPSIRPRPAEKSLPPRARDEQPAARRFSPGAIYRRIGKRARVYGLAACVIAGLVAYMNLPEGSSPLASFGIRTTDKLAGRIAQVRMLQSQGKLEEAMATAREMVTEHASSSEAHLLLGELLAIQKRNEEAIAEYTKVKALTPPQPLVHVRLIQLYLKSELAAEAQAELQLLDKAIQDGYHSRELFVEAGQLFLDMKDSKQPPEKTLILAKALQKEYAPGSTLGYKLEAQALFNKNMTQEALGALSKGLEIDPQDEWLLENTAFAKLSLRDVAGAQAAVERWLQIRPDAAKAMLVMAYLRFNEKNYVGAVPYLQKIVAMAVTNPAEPHYPEALGLMAQIYQVQGQVSDAVNFHRQACEAGFQQSCENELLKGGGSAPASTDGQARPPAGEPESAPTAPPAAKAQPPAKRRPSP